MNGFLWLGVISTAVLLIAIAVDGFDFSFDVIELGSEWLSLPVVMAFLAAFGFVTGAAIEPLGPPALLLGGAGGLLFGWGAVRLSRAFMHMPTDPTETAADLLASFGRIVTPPTGQRYGAVLLQRPTGPLKVACTSDDELSAGDEVVVVDVVSSTLVAVVVFDADSPPQLPS